MDAVFQTLLHVPSQLTDRPTNYLCRAKFFLWD